MSLRNRVLYSAIALGVGPTPATGYHFAGGNVGDNRIQTITRVQTVSDGFTQNRQNVLQAGQLSIAGRIITEPPSVPLDFTYLVSDVSNERKLGFYVSGNSGAMALMLDKSQDEKNYFIEVAPEGVDAIGYAGESQTKYITNGFISSWSTEGAVGGLPTTSVSVVGLNYEISTGSSNIDLRAVDTTNNSIINGVKFTLPVASSGAADAVAAIRPSDIVLSVGNGIGINMNDIKLQRYNITANLNRQNLDKLGSFFSYAKEVQFPAEVTASVTAYYGDLTTGSLALLKCGDEEVNLSVTLYQPTCTGRGNIAAKYTLMGAKLDSQSFSQGVNDIASSVTLNFTTSIGSKTDNVHNLFISGIST